MSLKGLFDTVAVTKIVDNKTSAEIGRVVESADYHEADIIDEKRFVPAIDFSDPKNFAKYGSAEKYYEDSYTYIYSSYPYDGSLAEKLQWKNSGSYVDLYIFDNKYPRTTGYINFSYGGWGSHGSAPKTINSGYGRPQTSDLEYISFNGGPGLGGGVHSQSANVWDPNNNRESNLEVDPTEGVTVEFWLKKDAFDASLTQKEVVFDLWNNELSSSADYGRLCIELTASGGPTWLATLMSGTTGFQSQSLGSITDTQIADGKWHHHAFSFLSAAAGVTSKYYLDGALETTTLLGSTGIDKISGSMQAHIGSLITTPPGPMYHTLNMTGSGKLSASLDEFRYWKTQRSSEKIGRYWFTQVGGGTNTDLANTDLGVYYKFNEGITGVTATDSTILDFSGRVTNGTWTGYTVGSRNTGSAMVSASATTSEFLDPIIYSFHPEVQSTLTSLKNSGSVHDVVNPSSLFGYFPSWMQEQDPDHGDELKKLTQIISSYLDTLYLQIESFSDIHNISYISGSITKENTLAEQLLSSKGLLAPELFLDADILEKLGDRSEDRKYADSLNNIKNKIYKNIYNNLTSIYKTKGTRQSFRNLLRCFGIDEKIYRLNVYGENVQFKIRNNRDLYSAKKRFVDFSVNTNFESTVFLSSSALASAPGATTGSAYLASSTHLTGGYASTLEAYVQFPRKPEPYEKAYDTYAYNYISSSLFGQHTTTQADPDSLSWATPDSTNFQVYAVRDSIGSKDAKFLLTSSANAGVISPITSSYYDDVYTNTNWVFAVTIKPVKYPLVNYINGTSTTDYIVEFKGTQIDAGEIINSFVVTGAIDPDQVGYGFLTGSKRPYIGAHRQDFEGAVLNRSDVRVGFCRYWLDDIPMDLLQDHGRDVQNYGTKMPSRSPYLFQGYQTPNADFLEGDTLALNWDFETVTGSNAHGEFGVPDFSSGSVSAQASQFGILGNLLRAQHTGYGYGFPASTSASIDTDYILASELQDFERLNSSDMISVLNTQDDVEFTRESRPINYLYSIEKSMYQSISEEMVRMFGVITDFNNIIGNPVNKYRDHYKGLRILREKFFERVGNTPDLDKYIEFYKWFDSSLSEIIQQLIPAGASFSKNIRNTIESHMLERSKYQFRFPTMELNDPILQANVLSPLPLSPGWQYTHHPVNDQENTNANWWKNVAARNKGKLATGTTALDNNKQTYFNSSTSERRARKEKNVYRFISNRKPAIRAGTTTQENKKLNFVFDATAPYGPVVPNTNIPQNIMLSFRSDVEELKDIVDDLRPGKKKRLGFGIDPTINNRPGKLKQDGNILAPFSLYSSSVSNGYNANVVDFYTASVLLTNLHEDIVLTNETRPLQGPFTEKFVGGREYRHGQLNSGPYLDTRTSRPEGFRLEFGLNASAAEYSGALGIVPPNYPFLDSLMSEVTGGFLPNLPTAQRLRDEGAKRPVNIKNILMTTASAGSRLSGTILHSKLGNYTKNYQVIQSAGRTSNDPFFQDQSFSFASNPLASNQTIRGRFPLANADGTAATPNVGFTEYTLPQRTGANSNKTIFVNKFSAPGGYSSISPGYLDPAHEEKSVYNVLPYRNLSVLNYGVYESASADSSTALTMHVDQDFENNTSVARGLRQRLVAHNEPYGYDGVYTTLPAYYKVNRNARTKIKDSDGNTTHTYDNYFVHRPIPRSIKQYQWVTSSYDASYASPGKFYGYSELSGGYFVESLPTISSSLAYGNLPFVYMNAYQGLLDPVTGSSNTLGFPLSSPTTSYRNLEWFGAFSPSAYVKALFNSLMLRRNGPYQAPSWKQLRYGAHPVIRNHKKNSILSTRIKTSYDVQIGARKGNSITQVVEPWVYACEFPMIHTFNMGTGRSFNIELKTSYGNKLINFANYEINNLLNLQRNYDSGDLYFNRINSMILRGENRDDSLNRALSNISAIYSQTVYPAAYNAFLGRTRSRKSYSIADIWNNSRGLRSNAARENSQGTNITKQCIEYPSKWSTDAHHVYSSSVSITYDDGAGELQNSYSRYIVERCLRSLKVVHPAATYNARIPLGTFSSSVAAISGPYPAYVGDRYNLVMGTFSGSIAPAGSGKTPYKTYEEYSKYLRIIGKDYSIVPEFRISQHLEEYLEGEDFTTLSNIDDLLELTGSGYVNSSEDGFFKEYSNSDFMKMFDLVNDAYDGAHLVDGAQMAQDQIGLRCNAFLQFLPYKGFYPAERTLELASLFSQSFGAQIDKTAENVAEGAVYRAILEPLYSQGVMYNTIKSGIAVSNFIISNTSSAPASITGSTQSGSWWNPAIPALTSSNISASAVRTNVATSLPEGNVFFEYMLPPFASASGSYLGHPDGPYGGQKALWNENGYFFEKIPFEALYQPRNYLSQDYIPYTGRIYDTGLHSASLMAYASGAAGQYDASDANYVTWDGQGDRRYELAIDNFLCETVNFFQNGLASITSAREEDFGAVTSGSVYTMKLKLYRPTTSSLGHAWADTGSIIPDYNKFDMYRRVSAFGPPIASKQYSSYLNFAGTGSYKASFSHLTPPYFAGSGSCTFTYTASANGSPTLDDIFAGLSISYDRMEFVELKNGAGTFGIQDMSDYKVQLKDSFNLTQSINSVPANTRTLKKQWLIQSKFETPIINIPGDRRTCGTAEVAGAAATGLVALTSSVISSAAATGYIELTASAYGGATATGSVKITGEVTTGKILTFTGSSGTVYTYQADTGVTRVNPSYAETNNVWYFYKGGTAAQTATELYNAMTASNFVAVDSAVIQNPSEGVRITASVEGTAGNFALQSSLGEAIVLGMGGGVNPTNSITEDDQWTISDGGTDGGSATSLIFALTASGGSCPGGAEACALIDMSNIAQTATDLAAKINNIDGFNITATVSSPDKTKARIILTNGTTGSAGNVTITATTSSAGNGYQAISGMAGGANAVYSLVTMDRFTLSDGGTDGSSTSATFKLKTGASAADEAELVASNASSSAANLVAKINAYTNLGVTATPGTGNSAGNAFITLTNDNDGSDGNVTIGLIVDDESYWAASGMEGGVTHVSSSVYGDVYGSLPEATPAETVVPIPPAVTAGTSTTTVTPNCELYTQGLWHDYGFVPSGSDEGVFAVIESPSPKEGKSLAELVGMPIGKPYRIGEVKSRNLLEEAVVAVPFFVGQDNRRKFYKLDEDSKTSIDSIAGHLEKYIFPPRLDFVRNPEMDPVAMYVFEFSRAVTQKDIADMWQNLPPSINETFEQKVTVIEHKLLRDQMLNTENRKLRQDLRWMVFKAKKRAATDYTRFVKKGLIDDTTVIPSNIQDAKYSYNWPYDYFSLVELVKIDEAIEYTSTLPADSRIEILGDVDIRASEALAVRVVEEE
mgnify:CR=1 FL=1